MRTPGLLILLLIALLPLGGCYYMQAASGHLALMRAAEPIDRVLADSGTDAELARALEQAQAIRRFAVETLGLPDNASYTRYADLGREAVVWNVVAVPEFSLAPKIWCFPVAGCLSYRGYFSEQRARRHATRLAAEGYHVQVGQVAAYSTLGRFADPLLNTMVSRGETYLAGIIFHELAHQQLYIADDTRFNEAYATAVEEHGTRLWLTHTGQTLALADYERLLARRGMLDALLERQRERLAALYASGLSAEEMRQAEAEAFQQLRLDYAEQRADWVEGPTFDGFFARPLNNAHLLAVATYRDLVPAFHRLIALSADMPDFHARAAELGALAPEDRHAALQSLQAGGSCIQN
ncbi:MAG: aminopeptidase [Gammaproteobacteria bacterium]|nr:aminopeptidase [Gammaproteobacteria bacterium]